MRGIASIQTEHGLLFPRKSNGPYDLLIQKPMESIGIPHKPSGAVWKTAEYVGYLKRMIKAYEIFNVPSGASVVADVGCGPRGGIFSVRKWVNMYGVDPSWRFYEEHGLVQLWDQWMGSKGCFTAIESYAQTFKLPQPADVIFSVNAINHCGSLPASIENIMGNLKPQGIFLLHIHLRTKDNIEPGHPMIVSENDVTSALSRWIVKRFDVHATDPIRGKGCRTIIAEVVGK